MHNCSMYNSRGGPLLQGKAKKQELPSVTKAGKQEHQLDHTLEYISYQVSYRVADKNKWQGR